MGPSQLIKIHPLREAPTSKTQLREEKQTDSNSEDTESSSPLHGQLNKLEKKDRPFIRLATSMLKWILAEGQMTRTELIGKGSLH